MAPLCLNLFFRSALILLAADLLRRFLPRLAARQRHALLFTGFVSLLLWPVLALAIPELDISLVNAPHTGDSVTVQESMFVSGLHLQRSFLIYWPVMLWLVGVIVSLTPLLLGFFKTRSLSRRASLLNDPEWNNLLHSLCMDLGLTNTPQLLILPDAIMPCLFGVVRPKILLPLECTTWTALRRRTVLLHELAHIQRRDVAAQVFASIVGAFWWFQPICRTTYSALRKESEFACDAIVTAAGMKASDYAAELLQIARSFQQRQNYASGAVMMATNGDLEPRVRAILAPARNQSRRFSQAAISSLALVTLTASAVTTKEGQTMKRTLLSGLLASAGLSAATIGGSLLDATGAAIPGAKASLYNPDTTAAQETDTTADGKFSFAVPAGQYILRIQKPGFASLFREFNVQSDSKVTRTMTLTEAGPKQVRVGGEVMQSKLVQKVQPIYPASAKEARLQGTVSLEAVISADGVPEDIKVLSSPGDDLTQSALEAVRQWRYSNTLLNGEPITVITNIVVNYTLRQ